MRKDLNMRKGKMVVQGAHASIGAIKNMSLMNRRVVSEWKKEGSTKICVGVESEQELLVLAQSAIIADVPYYVVMDAGRTEFKEPTITALAIGPAKAEDVDKITGKLTLL